jgi:hypothetical protein
MLSDVEFKTKLLVLLPIRLLVEIVLEVVKLKLVLLDS